MNHGAVALVTLVKPPHNLIDAALTGGIVAAYDRAVAEQKRCTLLRSGMRRFCAGGGCSPSVILQVSESNLAISVVRSTAEFADTDWAAERGAIDGVDDRAGGTVRMPGAPWRFGGASLPAPGVPAFQGEHNAEILREQGVADDVVAELQSRRVLLSRRAPRGAYD